MRVFVNLLKLRRARRLLRAILVATAAAGLMPGFAPVGADPAPSRFNNLQVLPEDASVAEVFAVMKLITRALGTECRACHLSAERNFDSDELALKTTARAMMQLEQARRPDFDWRAPPAGLCLDCHQGRLRPPAAAETGYSQ